jgi:hypothetical protein
MKAIALAIRIVSGLFGLALMTLGALIWTGNFDQLIFVHMSLGIFLVLMLWLAATLAAFRRIPPMLIIAGAAWGLVEIALGLTQERLILGDAHWVIQLVHLLFGLITIALTQILASRIYNAPARPDAREANAAHA